MSPFAFVDIAERLAGQERIITVASIAVAWVLGLLIVHRFSFKKLVSITQKHADGFDNVLVESLIKPIAFVILASGVGIAQGQLNLDPAWDKSLVLILRGLILLAAVLFGTKLLDSIVRHYGHREKVKILASGAVCNLLKGVIAGAGLLIFLTMLDVSMAPILLLLCVGFFAVALALQRIIFTRLRKYAQTSASKVDNILIESLNVPVTLLIFAGGVYMGQGFIHLGPRFFSLMALIFKGLFVLAVVAFANGLVNSLLRYYGEAERFRVISGGIFRVLLKTLLIGLGLLVYLEMIGVSITPILASLGIGSLAVALALQDTLNNLFAGVYVMMDKPVRIGDLIKLENSEEGYVMEIGWRSTRLRTPTNSVVVIPNNKLMGNILTNYYMPNKEIVVPISVAVHNESDLKQVEKVTLEVAQDILRTIPGGVPSFQPGLGYHAFKEGSVEFTVVLRAKGVENQGVLKHEFIKALHQRYRQEKIKFPRPHEGPWEIRELSPSKVA